MLVICLDTESHHSALRWFERKPVHRLRKRAGEGRRTGIPGDNKRTCLPACIYVYMSCTHACMRAGEQRKKQTTILDYCLDLTGCTPKSTSPSEIFPLDVRDTTTVPNGRMIDGGERHSRFVFTREEGSSSRKIVQIKGQKASATRSMPIQYIHI